MKNLESFRISAVWLAALGLMLPSTVLGTPPTQAQQQSVRDVILDETGTLMGRVIDTKGSPLSHVPIQVRRNGQIVANTMTDEKGQFTASQLAGGIYSVATPNQRTICRIWPADAAPPDRSTRNSAHRRPDHTRPMRIRVY